MATFYCWHNNAVMVVVPERVYHQMALDRQRMLEAERRGEDVRLPLSRPVFVFTDIPDFDRIVTGSGKMMDCLLKGHRVEKGHAWVPFSNVGGSLKGLLQKLTEDPRELIQLGTLGEVIEEFGLVRSDELVVIS